MNAKISSVLLILFVVSHTCDGLICYVCSSSQSVFDSNCDAGNSNVRTGVCPTNYKACSVKRFTYPDGSKGVLRDCALPTTNNKDEGRSIGEARLGTVEYQCSYNYCNDARAEGGNSAACHLGQSMSIWVLVGMVFFYLQFN